MEARRKAISLNQVDTQIPGMEPVYTNTFDRGARYVTVTQSSQAPGRVASSAMVSRYQAISRGNTPSRLALASMRSATKSILTRRVKNTQTNYNN